jgi:hypothetical protein
LQVAVLGSLSAISLAGFVGCGSSSASQAKAITASGGKMGDKMMSTDTMDKMAGDKMGMDKMAADKMGGDKMNGKMAKDQSP